MVTSDMRARAQGAFMGQLVGDALGSQVEFMPPQRIRALYPQGVRHMRVGGTWGTLAGQITDDSEMALLLARMLVKHASYDAYTARWHYKYWLYTEPFDCGNTIRAALQGRCTSESQANGALMRVSPLGIFGARYKEESLVRWAMLDAGITHPNPICKQVNALYALAVAEAVRCRNNPECLYQSMIDWTRELRIDPVLRETVDMAAAQPPEDYVRNQGWVVTAFHNAIWQMLHARDFEEALVDTISRGGDTDTNAAICGALMGGIYGLAAIPERWTEAVLNCRPEEGSPEVRHPRPRCLWATDALELADKLVGYEAELHADTFQRRDYAISV